MHSVRQMIFLSILIPFYSVRMRENTVKKNSEYGHFSRSDIGLITIINDETNSHVRIFDYKFSKIANDIIEIPKPVKKGVSYLQRVRFFHSKIFSNL